MPKLNVRETPNTWRVATRAKPRKEPDEWAMLQFGKGIQAVRYRKGSEWYTQSLVFDKADWTRAEALKWAKDYMKGGHMANPEKIVRERAGPGKFEGGDTVTERLYEMVLEGWTVEETGDVESAYGWYGLLDLSGDPLIVDEGDDEESVIEAAICHEDSQGFFDATEFDSINEARKAWAELVKEVEEGEAEGFLDVLTSERSSIVEGMDTIAGRYRKQWGHAPEPDVLAEQYADQWEAPIENKEVRKALEEIAEEVLEDFD